MKIAIYLLVRFFASAAGQDVKMLSVLLIVNILHVFTMSVKLKKSVTPVLISGMLIMVVLAYGMKKKQHQIKSAWLNVHSLIFILNAQLVGLVEVAAILIPVITATLNK